MCLTLQREATSVGAQCVRVVQTLLWCLESSEKMSRWLQPVTCDLNHCAEPGARLFRPCAVCGAIRGETYPPKKVRYTCSLAGNSQVQTSREKGSNAWLFVTYVHFFPFSFPLKTSEWVCEWSRSCDAPGIYEAFYNVLNRTSQAWICPTFKPQNVLNITHHTCAFKQLMCCNPAVF